MSVSHFPNGNRDNSMDCLEGQRKVVDNFKSDNWGNKI